MIQNTDIELQPRWIATLSSWERWLVARNAATKTRHAYIADVMRLAVSEGSVSAVSFQDAIEQGVKRANKTLKNVKGAWVKDQEVTIDKGKVTGYKVILKVTFILQD